MTHSFFRQNSSTIFLSVMFTLTPPQTLLRTYPGRKIGGEQELSWRNAFHGRIQGVAQRVFRDAGERCGLEYSKSWHQLADEDLQTRFLGALGRNAEHRIPQRRAGDSWSF